MNHKTRLGLSVGLVGGITYLCGLFGGLLVLLLASAFIFLYEDNMWLKRTALKALVLLLAFSVLQAVIGILPDLMRLFSGFAVLFHSYFEPEFIYNLESVLLSAVHLGKNVLFLVLGLLAFDQRDLRLGKLDEWIEKKLKE